MGQERDITVASSLRWAVLTCLLATLTGLVCYWVGLTRAEEPTARAARPAAVAPARGAPGFIPLDRISRLDRAALVLARDRAYVEGRRKGLAEGRRAAERAYAPGGPGWRRIVDDARRPPRDMKRP